MRSRFLLSLLFLALGALSAAAQESSPDRIAGRFFPQELKFPGPLARPSFFGPGPELISATVLERDRKGEPSLILAAYSNGINGVVRLIERRGKGFVIAQSLAKVRYVGSTPFLNVVDLNGDGVDEIIVSFYAGTSSQYVFKLVGRQLVDLTPTATADNGTAYSLLFDSAPIDIDHNGRLHLLSWEDMVKTPYRPFQVAKPVLYRLSDEGFVLDRKPIAAIGVSAEVAADWHEYDFVRPEGASQPFRVTVINGTTGGRNRVASGQVWLNSKQILDADELNRNNSRVTRIVPLREINTLRVRLEGKGRERIFILVESPSEQ